MLDSIKYIELKKMLMEDDAIDVYKDGYPYEYFEELDNRQKRELISLLLGNVANGDWRIVAGLGLLKVSSSEEQLKIKLKEAIENKDGMLVVHSALSLWKIVGYEKSFDIICDVLFNYDDGSFEAIKALSEFNNQKSISILVELLNNDNELIRSRAVHSIMKITNIPTIESNGRPHKWILSMISEDLNEAAICKKEIILFLKRRGFEI